MSSVFPPSHPHILALSDLLDQRVFPDFESLEAQAGKPVHVAGLAGSAASALVAAQFRRGEKSGSSILYLAPDAKDAEAMAEDLASWIGEDAVLHFPVLNSNLMSGASPLGKSASAV